MIRAATADDPLRIAVLASGRGSNLAALMERLDPAVTIVAVASNRGDAVALQRAREEEIETAVFPRGDDWAERDRRLLTWLVERQVELVVGCVAAPAGGDRLGRLHRGEGAGELVGCHQNSHAPILTGA